MSFSITTAAGTWRVAGLEGSWALTRPYGDLIGVFAPLRRPRIEVIRAFAGAPPAATLSTRAPVAQLDRASVYGTEGHRFESCRARSAVPPNRRAARKEGRCRSVPA